MSNRHPFRRTSGRRLVPEEDVDVTIAQLLRQADEISSWFSEPGSTSSVDLPEFKSLLGERLQLVFNPGRGIAGRGFDFLRYYMDEEELRMLSDDDLEQWEATLFHEFRPYHEPLNDRIQIEPPRGLETDHERAIRESIRKRKDDDDQG